IGRAEVADEVVGPNFTELWISLDPDVDYQPTIRKIQEVVDGYPGLYRDLLTYLKERIKEVLTGSSAALVVRLYGPDLELLRAKAREAADSMSDIPGVVDLHVEQQVMIPQIEMRFRSDQGRRFGLTSGHVRHAAATLIQGLKVGEIYDEQKIFDVTVWGVPRLRNDVFSLGEIRIDTPSGASIPLRDVADIRIAPTPNSIAHENGSRKIDVSCNIRGGDLGTVARQIEERVLAIDFPHGYHPEFLGEYTARRESRNRLFAFGALSLLGIFLILYSDFQSGRIALLIFFSLPFALVGAVLAAFLAGGVLSLGSLLGFVTVIGIAARNGILLVSHYRHLEREEGESFGRKLIIRGSEERLSPILMTATTTALALLPIALGGSRPGHEIEYPMAVIIIGGLVTSTVLNLVLMPVLYERFGRQPGENRKTA
ncbi:MAG TPA: efflux RND transporter permease subunit, partial [Anaerolineales bacterium]|nr:efflux RND transporter permease subunit [Anaerolineales bacterium]